jgi:hypothetical protein
MVSALGACSLITSLSGLSDGAADASGPEAASGEAAAVDAGSDANPTADAATDGGTTDGGTTDGESEASLPNIHPAGTFESGTTCDPWGYFESTISWNDVAHTGKGSCRVCSVTGKTDGFTADDKGIIGSAPIGAVYHLSAWLRAAPGSSVATTGYVVLRTINFPSYDTIEGLSSDSVLLTDTWQKLDTTLTVNGAADALDVVIAGDYAADACFLFDDVVVERIK